MTDQIVQFLLVPDSSAARRMRRSIAEASACQGIVVGTWMELVEHASRVYLIPSQDDDWIDAFNKALAEMSDAFWTESLSVSPQETSVAIENALIPIISASDSFDAFSMPDFGDLPERPRRHLEDLIRLTEILEGRLPPELSRIRDLIGADVSGAIQRIFVYQVDGVPALTRWQVLLIEKLNNDSEVSADLNLSEKLKETLSAVEESNSPAGLAALQTQLFSPHMEKIELDNSVQWVGVRDFLEEAEVAAGMVQAILEEHDELCPANIGLLLPESFEYSVAVDDALRTQVLRFPVYQ